MALLFNLMLAVGAGFLGAVLAARFRQSVVVGYIAAGIAIGPFTPGLVGDVETVQALADIGIVFLLFAVGAQFSIDDLLRLGRVAVLGASVQVLALIGLGYLVGLALGWQPMEALFLGAVVSNSSSTVISKVLGERGQTDSPHGSLALAWSAVQDTTTVVLVVILSALAGGGAQWPGELAVSVGKAGLFLILLIPLGLRVFPAFFERVAALRNREVFILAVSAVALGTAYAASWFGISVALGAFIAGVVVSKSDLSHHIIGEITPQRDIFAALFFVSVGMLVQPAAVAANPLAMLAMLALIIPVKGALSAIIGLLAGNATRTAVLAGASLAQSAEFSFILATVGANLGVLRPDIFAVLLAGTVFSVVLAPYVYDSSLPLAPRLEGASLLRRWRGEQGETARVEPGLRGHAVLVGYGRVGRIVASVLDRRTLPLVVVDEDFDAVKDARRRGFLTLFGNAANPSILEQAGIGRSRVLILAVPDPVVSRLVVDFARLANPRIDIVARTHSSAERRALQRSGVNEAVLGELELALELSRHTLHRFGVQSAETAALLQNLRLHADIEEGEPFPEQ